MPHVFCFPEIFGPWSILIIKMLLWFLCVRLPCLWGNAGGFVPVHHRAVTQLGDTDMAPLLAQLEAAVAMADVQGDMELSKYPKQLDTAVFFHQTAHRALFSPRVVFPQWQAVLSIGGSVLNPAKTQSRRSFCFTYFIPHFSLVTHMKVAAAGVFKCFFKLCELVVCCGRKMNTEMWMCVSGFFWIVSLLVCAVLILTRTICWELWFSFLNHEMLT